MTACVHKHLRWWNPWDIHTTLLTIYWSKLHRGSKSWNTESLQLYSTSASGVITKWLLSRQLQPQGDTWLTLGQAAANWQGLHPRGYDMWWSTSLATHHTATYLRGMFVHALSMRVYVLCVYVDISGDASSFKEYCQTDACHFHIVS